MQDLNQLQELVGKTIKSIHQQSDYDAPLTIIFDDNTKLVCIAQGDDMTYLDCYVNDN